MVVTGTQAESSEQTHSHLGRGTMAMVYCRAKRTKRSNKKNSDTQISLWSTYFSFSFYFLFAPSAATLSDRNRVHVRVRAAAEVANDNRFFFVGRTPAPAPAPVGPTQKIKTDGRQNDMGAQILCSVLAWL